MICHRLVLLRHSILDAARQSAPQRKWFLSKNGCPCSRHTSRANWRCGLWVNRVAKLVDRACRAGGCCALGCAALSLCTCCASCHQCALFGRPPRYQRPTVLSELQQLSPHVRRPRSKPQVRGPQIAVTDCAYRANWALENHAKKRAQTAMRARSFLRGRGWIQGLCARSKLGSWANPWAEPSCATKRRLVQYGFEISKKLQPP